MIKTKWACMNRFYRYKKLPDYYRMRISDTDFMTDEDLTYINNLKDYESKN